MKEPRQIKIQEGDIVRFYYTDAQKSKYAVTVEIVKIRKNSFIGEALGIV